MTIFSDKAERKGSIGIVSVETYQFPGAVARCIVFRWGVFSILCWESDCFLLETKGHDDVSLLTFWTKSQSRLHLPNEFTIPLADIKSELVGI